AGGTRDHRGLHRRPRARRCAGAGRDRRASGRRAPLLRQHATRPGPPRGDRARGAGGARRDRASDGAAQRLRPGIARWSTWASRALTTSTRRSAMERVDATAREVRVTTTGRRTGRRHTIPLWFVARGAAGPLYLWHCRGRTDWVANVRASGRLDLDFG